LALLLAEVSAPSARTAALLGAAIAVALVPLTPPGVPVLIAAVAALLGLTRWGRSPQ
ncbi:MAG: branched-chain amino acid ABC transporter permease, partial [Actinomycetota bacterium]|nr:branched-chain amino acid ABC transporter permease [Actinomycetota bacterium]